MLVISDLIGKPFVDGGRGPHEYDCWGLACEVFRRAGIELPDYGIGCEEAAQINEKIANERSNWVRCTGEIPVPALIVFTEHGICNHTGVYLGGGRFIHAREGSGVVTESVDSMLWRRRLEGYYVPRK